MAHHLPPLFHGYWSRRHGADSSINSYKTDGIKMGGNQVAPHFYSIKQHELRSPVTMNGSG